MLYGVKMLTPDRIYCKQCGWIGEIKDCNDDMGFDVSCPKCSSDSKSLTEYIPNKIIIYKIRLLYFMVDKILSKFVNNNKYWIMLNKIRTSKI